MKNNFKFFGLRAPLVKEVFKNFISYYSIQQNELKDLITYLWVKEEREYQMIAILFLNHYKKWLREEDLTLIQYCISHKSWWDSVESFATNILGHDINTYPRCIHPITEQWLKSNDISLQRNSLLLLFQLKYKTNTNLSILFNSILFLKDSSSKKRLAGH